jgi:DNA-binding response OmpR family regulator
MPSVTVFLSASLDALLQQAAALRGCTINSVLNTALSRYLAWRDHPGSKSAIRIGNIEIEPVRRLVRKNSVLVRLTPTECDLLHYLMLHARLPYLLTEPHYGYRFVDIAGIGEVLAEYEDHQVPSAPTFGRI